MLTRPLIEAHPGTRNWCAGNWFGRVLTRPLIEAGAAAAQDNLAAAFGRVLTRPLIEALTDNPELDRQEASLAEC